MGAPWPDAAVLTLRKLWGEGKAAPLIAKAISTPERVYTRNAVIGQAHRLGLKARAPVLPPKRRRAPIVRRAPLRRRPRAAPRAMPGPDPEYQGKPKSILEIGKHECRYTVRGSGHVGDPYLYCAAPAVRGSYCARHAKCIWGH